MHSGASPLRGSNTGKTLLQVYRRGFRNEKLLFAEDLDVRAAGPQYGSSSQNGPQRRQPAPHPWECRDVEPSKSWGNLEAASR